MADGISMDISRIIQNLNLAEEELTEAVKQAVAQGCLMIEADAKRLAPKDTGELQQSIHHKVMVEDGEVVGEVGTNLHYAPYVELGTGIHASNGKGRQTAWSYVNAKGEKVWTRGSKPKPFMYPSLKANQRRVKARIQSHLKGVIQRDQS